mmetsp:Transcript_15930/g.45490  ORF Transcript_15930/g.45490 Transcript_15930/m.45490 type:complete len:275 (-) Transcript_15930:450-1274(-)
MAWAPSSSKMSSLGHPAMAKSTRGSRCMPGRRHWATSTGTRTGRSPRRRRSGRRSARKGASRGSSGWDQAGSNLDVEARAAEKRASKNAARGPAAVLRPAPRSTWAVARARGFARIQCRTCRRRKRALRTRAGASPGASRKRTTWPRERRCTAASSRDSSPSAAAAMVTRLFPRKRCSRQLPPPPPGASTSAPRSTRKRTILYCSLSMASTSGGAPRPSVRLGMFRSARAPTSVLATSRWPLRTAACRGEMARPLSLGWCTAVFTSLREAARAR